MFMLTLIAAEYYVIINNGGESGSEGTKGSFRRKIYCWGNGGIDMEKGKIAFVGAGMIGAGLAVNAMMNGHPVTLYDVVSPADVEKRVQSIMDILVEAGAYTKEQTEEGMKRASYTDNLEEAVKDAIFVQECVTERLEVKRDVYARIQKVTGNGPVIASSTSALMPSDLQEGALYPDRILVGHPYNPSYLLPLMEICGGKQTSEEAKQYAKQVYTSMGKVASICLKEVYGYLVQNINFAIREMATKLVVDGIGTAEDVDRALMYGPGMRLPITGQLLTISQGVEGGWREMSRKYRGEEPTAEDIMVADQIDAELANRPPELGNTVESVNKFRDKMLVQMLKVQNML